MNETISAIRSWAWVPLAWILVYPSMLVVGLFLGTVFGPSYYWAATLVVVPFLVIPLTYRQLVDGGCSVRFQICALVKGMLVGFVFLFITMYIDPLVWSSISSFVGWNPLVSSEIAETVYYTWLFSGLLGGVGARVVEIRGHSQSTEVTIAGFE